MPLGRWLDAHVAMTRASRQLYKHVPGHDKTVDAEEQAGVAAIKNVGRPRERTDTFYREVAAIYNAAAADGDRSPAVRVEEQLGAGYASATARSWIQTHGSGASSLRSIENAGSQHGNKAETVIYDQDQQELTRIDGYAPWPPVGAVIEFGSPHKDALVREARLRLHQDYATLIVYVEVVAEKIPPWQKEG